MRIAESAKGRQKRAAAAGNADPLADIDAWQEVRVNRDVVCAQCARVIGRGEHAAFGVSGNPTAPKVWLCSACAGKL